jgi:hypothetical protein
VNELIGQVRWRDPTPIATRRKPRRYTGAAVAASSYSMRRPPWAAVTRPRIASFALCTS